jgi:GT2 family glycosyltransferase
MAIDHRDDNPHASGQEDAHELPPARRAEAILVLGMHRSGTSAVAGVLGLMGAYLGEPEALLPAHAKDNPAGYWERSDVMVAHDHALQACHFAWDQVAGFDPGMCLPQIRDMFADLSRPIIAGLRRSGATWLVKDPRLCLLLPLWLPLTEGAACVVVVRDPREIAASMHIGHRGVFTSSFIVALWEKYLATLLASLQGRKAIFISYARLLDDPHAQVERLISSLLDLGVGGLSTPTADALAQFLDPHLYRSTGRAHTQLSSAQSALYDWLLQQCAVGAAVTVAGYPAASDTDTVLAEFERSFEYRMELGRQRALSESAERQRSLETALQNQLQQGARWQQQAEHAQALAATQRQQLATSRQELDSLRERNAQLQAEVAALQAQYVQSRHDLAAQGDVLAKQRSRLAWLERHAQALDDSVRALVASWSWKITAPLRAVARLFFWRPSFGAEQRLHRWFYQLPGPSAAHKRALVVWLHEHAPWLTRHTLSYRLYRHARALEAQQARGQGTGTSIERMDAQRAQTIVAAMQHPPQISIVVPVYNVEARWLEAAVASVRRQFYPYWELCIADDASTRADTRAMLDALAKDADRRIKIVRLKQNSGIAAASNAALKLAHGDYVGLLDHDDELTRDALLEMARRIVADGPDLLYSDEDKLDESGRHVEPHFKPDYNEEYFYSNNYICHFAVIRRAVLSRIGGFRSGFDGAQDYDLLLRAAEHAHAIAHIPLVLYHWRRIPGSTAADSAAKPHTSEAGRRALAESLARRGIAARVEPGPYPNTYHVRRTIQSEPLVSILVPFRDKPELLETCVLSILKKTRYRNFELLGIDNNSAEKATHALMRALQRRDARIRFVTYKGAFNYSAINNYAARQARGEHLLFLNNDTEIIAPEWIEAMLEHSQRPEVGVVGAKLLYPDHRIQHAGVIIGMGGVAGHAHLFLAGDHPGYFARAQLMQDLSAITFACAMTRREVFDSVGGLNEHDLTIAFNDIDYCLRVREAGYRIVYTPLAALVHHESKSRGFEDNPEKQARFGREVAYMQQRHHAILQSGDPAFNPNLRLDCNDFSVRGDYVNSLPA